MTTDVVILGGGPVGCLLAILLNKMGVSNTLVERDMQPYQLPRAIVMDDEIQRILHDYGMGSWLEAHTSRLENADFVAADGSHILGQEVPALGLQGVPPVVVHFQPDLDAMLRYEAVQTGTIAHFGHTVTDMSDHGSHVMTTLDDGSVITSRWFVGCDGASSWTRKHVGLVLEDLRFDQPWLVVDVELFENSRAELPLGVRQYCDPARPSTYVKGHARNRRWEFQIQPGEDAQAMNTEAGLWELLAPWLTPADARIVRSALYRFHAVVAPELRSGNVFLAGDSAHQMPPFLGQGLNSGMRDAMNLAWRMGFVKRGVATDTLLDSYTTERVPHVRSVVGHAADVGRLIDQLAGRESEGIDTDSGYGGARPQPFIETGMVTGDDPRVGHQFWYHPLVSEAVVTNGGSFVLVSGTTVELPAELRALGCQCVVAPEAVENAYAIVVRPDRYVAAVAHNASELHRHAATLATYA
jgi:3-(3-hydroxy-phenyl)propionate hydroxylase